MPYLKEKIENRTFVNTLTSCVNTNVKEFKKEEFVINYGLKKQTIGLILEGVANLIKIDIDGNITILEQLSEGYIFSEIFMCYMKDSISVVCATDTKILFIDYNLILKDCKMKCENHNNAVKEIFQLLLDKAKLLNEKISILSSKTTQERIISYLEFQQLNQNKKTIILPFSYSDLANYLSVDRAALMREIKKMEALGILKKNNRKITLYKQ